MLGSLAPAFTVSNRLAKGSLRTKLLSGALQLIGINVTDSGCAPEDPEAAADLVAAYGQSWVRFHHLEGQDIAKVLAFADALLLRGIRFSIDLCSKLGEWFSDGIDGLKRDIYDRVVTARALYDDNIKRLVPLLKHAGCFLVCLINEGAHVTTPEKAAAHFNEYAPVVRGINPDLLVSDCPDAAQQADKAGWIETGKIYDVTLIHYYASDAQLDRDNVPCGRGNNIFDGWNWLDCVAHAKGTGKRVFVEEFGSFKSNPNQASNIAFVYLQGLQLGWSLNQFCLATNSEQYQGKGNDPYAILCDPLRLKMLLLGSYLAKNRSGLKTTYWGGDVANPDGTIGSWSERYEVVGDKVVANRHCVKVGIYVWNYNKEAPATWLTRVI